MSAASGLMLNVTVLVLMRDCEILDDTVSRFGLIAADTLMMSALTGGKCEPCTVQCTGRLKTVAVTGRSNERVSTGHHRGRTNIIIEVETVFWAAAGAHSVVYCVGRRLSSVDGHHQTHGVSVEIIKTWVALSFTRLAITMHDLIFGVVRHLTIYRTQ